MSRKYWYSYSGAPGQESQPGNYQLALGGPGVCPTSGFNICAVYALYGGDTPSAITTRLRSYIAVAKSAGTFEPKPGPAFVYVKP